MRDDADMDRQTAIVWMAAILSLVAAVLGLLVYWRRRHPQRPAPAVEAVSPPPRHIQGLSETEAAARRARDQVPSFVSPPQRATGWIWRDSVLNLFNLNMLALLAVQLVLGRPLDVFGIVLVTCSTIAVRVLQRTRARARLAQLERETRPKATVIREGQARSVDAAEIVPGDVLVAGPGDPFLADGTLLGREQVLVDESTLVATSGRQYKRRRNEVYAGSFCVRGRALYVARRVGAACRFASLLQPEQGHGRTPTPLQSLITQVLWALLILTISFLALWLLHAVRFPWTFVEEAYKEAALLILRLAPTGLFFTIVVAYAVSSLNLADVGALVRRTEHVESLANVSVLCLGRSSAITDIRAEIEPLGPRAGESALAHGRIGQILGDYARTTSVHSAISQALRDSFDGSVRHTRDEAPFLSLYGWSALAIDEEDLQGVYVLGDEAALSPHLQPAPGPVPDADTGQTQENDAAEEEGKPPRGLWGRIRNLLPSPATEAQREPESGEAVREEIELLFAYRPDLCSLRDHTGAPQLPDDLIPLCKVRYARHLRSGTRETLRAFSELGVEIKVLSREPPYQAAAAARQADLVAADAPLGVVAGPDLIGLSPDRLSQVAHANTIFGQLDAGLKRAVVSALRAQGERVAVVGDEVDDVAALQEADLGITTRSGHQAVITIADIVLLQNRLQVLLSILQRGQRAVNAVLDVLKLSLTQVVYLLVILVGARLSVRRLPYHPSQASYVWIFALGIPTLFLMFWPQGGALSAASMRRRLAHFVVPAGLTLGLAALGVYLYYTATTEQVDTGQLALTYALLWGGLLLVLFVQPPTRAWAGGDRLNGDLRYVRLVLVLLIVAMGMAFVPLTQRLFRIAPLVRVIDYAIVAGAVLLWALLVRWVWWLLIRLRGDMLGIKT